MNDLPPDVILEIARKVHTMSSRYVPLATHLSSTDWNGDAKTSANNGTIDLSSVFGAPAGIKAVSVRWITQSDTTGKEAALQITSAGASLCISNRHPATGTYVEQTSVCTCDANGDIYVSFASGANYLAWLIITGYWI